MGGQLRAAKRGGNAPPQWVIFSFTNLKNKYGISRRRNYEEKGNKNSPLQINIIFNNIHLLNPDSNTWLLRAYFPMETGEVVLGLVGDTYL